MAVKAKYIKDLPLKENLEGTDSLILQDDEGTKRSTVEAIGGKIAEEANKRVDELENELAQTNAQLSAKAPLTTVVEQGKRIDTIIANANSTDGNSELVDMRVSSDGTVFQTAGEHLRNISGSVLSYKKFHSAQVQFAGDSESKVVLTNPSNDFITMTATNTGSASYQYVYVRLNESIQNMVDNPKLIKILLNPSFTGTFNVAVSGKTNWSSGVVNRQDLFMEKGVSQVIEIDFSDSAIQEWLKDSDKSHGVYIFFIFRGNGTTDFTSGTRTISVGMFDVSTGTNKKVLSELSFNSVLAETANYAKVANYSETANQATRSAHSDEAEHAKNSELSNESVYAHTAYVSINAGVTPVDSSNIIGMVGATIERYESGYYMKKPVGVGTSFWIGLNLHITYDTLEDLDCKFNLNYKFIKGLPLSTCKIIKRSGDWNPNNSPYDIPFDRDINLYQIIMGMNDETLKQHYINSKELWIVYGGQTSTNDALKQQEVEWSIKPMFYSNNSTVVATSLSTNLQEELSQNIKSETISEVVSSISDIPLGVKTIEPQCISGIYLSTEQITATKHRVYKLDTENPANGWLRAYVQVKYDNLLELDKNLRLNIKYVESDTHVKFNNCKILDKKADWNPNNNPIDIFSKMDGDINLYQTIMEKDSLKDVYLNQNELWIVLGYFAGNNVDYTPFTMDCTIEPMFEAPNSMIIASDLNSSALEKVTNVVMEKVGNELQLDGGYITCWGDSLTAGGGWTSTLESLTGMKVYNGGTGGENSQTIMARQGGDVMIVDNLVIPSTTEPVTIATRSGDGGIKTALGNKVTPLLQGGAHVNPCYIGDIKGTLRWTGSNYADQTGVWTFTRSEAGERVVVNRPTAIRTDFDINRNRPRIMIIFIGQNGGYSSVDDLINQHRLMIEHSQATNFIVLGLSSGTASQRADYEKAMRKEFGRRFISLREYLSQYGLEDAGIEPTEQDVQMMNQGQTPQSLLSDSVHYNTQCKTVIGNMIYKKLKDLNMI